MSFLTDMIGGTIKSARNEIKQKEALNDEESRWQRRLEFQKKLEQELEARRPASTVYKDGKMIILNNRGEPIGERDATPLERKNADLAGRKADVEMEDMSPAERERKRRLEEEEIADTRATRAAQRGAYGAQAASAMEDVKTKRLERDLTEDAWGMHGPPSGRGGALGRAGADSGRTPSVRDMSALGGTLGRLGVLRAELEQKGDAASVLAVDSFFKRAAEMTPEQQALSASQLVADLEARTLK
jgi:hypothetical protein